MRTALPQKDTKSTYSKFTTEKIVIDGKITEDVWKSAEVAKDFVMIDPDNGKVIDHYPVHGRYDSVNPLALKLKNDIFIANERHVTLLQTENFGRLAYVEVGAICVGKIVQSHRWSKPFLRGEEKGYFLFGGSTVVLLGEKGAWKPSKDVVENTKNNIETYVTLGDEIAVKL